MNNLLRTLAESHTQVALPPAELTLLLNAAKEARKSSESKPADSFYDSLDSVVQDLRTVTMDNHDAEAFLKPVTRAEVPDYHEIISTPMDLGTVARKVKQRSYKSKREFKDDLDLIWNNCFTYNSTENHPLRQCATRLRAKAERLLKNITDRRERIDPTIPSDVLSRGSSPRMNGLNGHVIGRARPVTKSPSPFKPTIVVNGKHPRRDGTPSNEALFERTAEGMAAFMRLDRALDARLNEPHLTNGVMGPTLEEQLTQYTPLFAVDDLRDGSPSTIDGGIGEKRKLNGHADHRPRKRVRMADKDVVELWWDAMQSEVMLANGVPTLRYSQSDDPVDPAPSPAVNDPPRTPGVRVRKKRRKTGSTQSQNTLLYFMNNNINSLRRVRGTHARLSALKESLDDSAVPGVPGAPPVPQFNMPIPAAEEPEPTVDERAWTIPGSGGDLTGVDIGAANADDCLHWMGGKVLEHAGFQGASKAAMDVLAGVTSAYLLNVGRTMRFMVDKYSKQMTPEEIILHTLFESGVTRIHELERYIKDDVVRYGARLNDLEKKLTAAYEEATTVEAWDDDALFRLDDEEEDSEFVMGNFADSYGEDFFGLRELGIAEELGLSSLTIPKKLLKSKQHSMKLAESVEPKEPPPPFPPPPPFVPLDSTKIDDQIGLLRPYYQQRISTLAAAVMPPAQPPAMAPPPLPTIAPLPGVPPAPGMPGAFVPPSPFGPPTLTPPPPHPLQSIQPIMLPDDAPTPVHTKLGPLGQVLKSAPAAGNAAKKKAAPKPKTAEGEAPDTPMTAGTPTATAPSSDSPKKSKAGAGSGKKKKNTGEIPTIIMSTASY